jgi:hypothetical protein
MNRRYRSCRKKAAYRSWRAANRVRLRRIASGVIPPGLLSVYPCDFGDHYHLGHVSKRIRRQAMRRAG